MPPSPIHPAHVQAATAYHAQYQGRRLLIRHQNQLICDHSSLNTATDLPLPIASGTKSLAGILAVTALADGFLHLDEPVAHTLTEWTNHPLKSSITTRHLLQLTSGLSHTGKAGHTPDSHTALHTEPAAQPNQRFLYNSTPFQAFVEFARRKLAVVCPDPLDYLYGRVFDPLGLQPGQWRRTSDGWPDFSSGLSIAAQEWAKLGEWIRQDGQWEHREIIPAHCLQECFTGSDQNPAYGLGWWLNTPLPQSSKIHLKQSTLGLEDLHSEPAVPSDLVYAAGAGKQRLYISREHELVIVRQADGIPEALASGERSPFSDREFFRILLTGRPAFEPLSTNI
jgi:CubicO group peptidase (beta-lactamase class C family)